VINDILDLSKIEAGKLSVERVKTSLVGVLYEVISLLQAQATGKGIELRSVLLTPVPEFVTSDPTRLRQILLNLVGNAVKFTEIGNVTISVGVMRGDAQSQLVIDVDDTGPGMTTEQAEQLFAAFSQGDTTVTRKHGGTGLGLIISLRLASLMGGTVTLLRTQLGHGSCFRLELPVEIAADTQLVTRLECVQSNTIKETQELGQLSGRILLAEDGPDNQKLIQYHLSKAGATVEIADNGRVALEMLDHAARLGRPFELLLTDIQMPELDGLSLTRILRQRGDTIPIVALTAHAMAEDRLKCLHAGCSDYATKPINKSALVATCREWIEVSRGESEVETPDCVAPLLSQLAGDPDMAPLLREFLGGLKAKMDTLREDLAARRLSQMATLAHQLKGAAGGYGFPEIGDAAALLERQCASSEQLEPIRLALAALAEICERAVAGGVDSEELIEI
jgi:CheY-like chemotaxis protein